MTFRINFWLITILLSLCTLPKSSGETDGAPSVRVKQGLTSGIKEASVAGRDIYSYYKIPFAKPPLAELRFKDPVPPVSWEGVRDGSKMPEPCYQHPIVSLLIGNVTGYTPEGTEDCLYLNVFTSKPNEPDAHLPVMVFIHGGAFFGGGAYDYLPYSLLDKDVVLVVLQYRLGIFGFLSTEDTIMPGNMGLKDQQMGLRWVQQNIQSFGGDPQSVTIFGESAGGASVHYQVLSPGSKDLFKGAIAQSGSALCPWAWSEGHRDFAIKIGDHLDCPLNEDSEAFLKCMQKKDPSSLIEFASAQQKWGMAAVSILPRVDGVFLPEKPEVLMKEGKYNKVQFMTGLTRDEGIFTMLMLYSTPSMIENVNNNFKEYGPLSLYLHNSPNGEELASRVYKHYLGTDDIKIKLYDERIIKLFSDSYFVEAVDLTAHTHARNGGTPLFTYKLDYPGTGTLSLLIPGFENQNWVCHADDLFYLFHGSDHTFSTDMNSEDLKVREIFLTLWTNFAKYGNPTPKGSEFTWEPTTTENFNHLSITPNPKMIPDFFKEGRELWKEIREEQRRGFSSGESSSGKASKQEL